MSSAGPRPLFLLFFLFALGGYGAVPACPPAQAQEAARSSTEGSSEAEREVSAQFYPWALYSQTDGFGVGGGVKVEDAWAPGADVLATAQPSQHEGRYALTLTTADLYAAPRYLLLRARYRTTGRQWFYGLGPGARSGDRLAVERRTFETAVRFGLRPAGLPFSEAWGRWLLVEPRLALHGDRGRGFSNDDDGAFARLGAPSQANVQAALGRRPATRATRWGLAPGLRLAVDTRDRPVRTTRGVFAEVLAQQYESLNDVDLRFRTFDASASGFVPVAPGSGHVLALRARLTLMDRLGESRMPFYYLATLDSRVLPGFPRGRFYGPRRLLAEAQYRFPLYDAFGLARLEAFVGAGAGSVYTDLSGQFSARLAFGETLAPDRDRYPLRPALSAGVRLLPLFRDQLLAGFTVGYSADGFTLTGFRFVLDGLTLRPSDDL